MFGFSAVISAAAKLVQLIERWTINRKIVGCGLQFQLGPRILIIVEAQPDEIRWQHCVQFDRPEI